LIVAGSQCRFGLGLERHAGEREEQHHDAGVDDVAAVAAAVAAHQPRQRERPCLAVLAVPRGRAAPELLRDGAGDETAARDRQQRADVAHPNDEQNE